MYQDRLNTIIQIHKVLSTSPLFSQIDIIYRDKNNKVYSSNLKYMFLYLINEFTLYINNKTYYQMLIQ